MRNFEIILYDNLFLNEDGLWAADGNYTSKCILISDKDRPKDVCNKLVEMGFLPSSNMRTIHVTDISKDIIEIKEKKGMKPICRLKRIFYA